MLTESLKYELQKYAKVVFVSVLLFVGFSTYISLRRGYYDLYIINKVLAGVAAIDFSIIILLGSLSRLFNFVDKHLELRKEFGIVGMVLAVTHAVSSFFFLSNKFPPKFYFENQLLPFIFGLIAIAILISLFIISFEKIIILLGRDRWWKISYWGMRGLFVLTILHVFVMKWNGWVDWYMKGGTKELVHPEWPGGGLIVGWFLAFTLLVRSAELFRPRIGKIVWYLTVVLLPIIYFLTFWRGSYIFLK